MNTETYGGIEYIVSLDDDGMATYEPSQQPETYAIPAPATMTVEG